MNTTDCHVQHWTSIHTESLISSTGKLNQDIWNETFRYYLCERYQRTTVLIYWWKLEDDTYYLFLDVMVPIQDVSIAQPIVTELLEQLGGVPALETTLLDLG